MNQRKFEDRCVLTAYVKRATGEWHDKEVAVLLSASNETYYDEDMHRQWRLSHLHEIESFPIDEWIRLVKMLEEGDLKE